MHSVAEVLQPDFPRSWQEAVAIVQAAAVQMMPGVGLPEPDDLQFDDDGGGLVFGFGSESGQDPVESLAVLLKALLEGVEAPASLKDLAKENARPSPAHATVASFSQALAFFERPNRANDLRAVAGRLHSRRQRTSYDDEFERLRQKVAQTPPPAAPVETGEKTRPVAEEEKKVEEKKPEQPKRRQLTRRERTLAVAALVIVVFGTLAVRSGVHREVVGAVSQVEGNLGDAISAGLSRVGLNGSEKAVEPKTSSVSTSAPRTTSEAVEKDERKTITRPKPTSSRPVSRAASAPEASGGARVSRNSSGANTPPSPSPSPSATSGESSRPEERPVSQTSAAVTPVKPPVPQLPPPAVARTSTPQSSPPPYSNRIYSIQNPEVQPPTLVRPQMPREPAPGDDTGYFDIVVDESGDVAHIKLISPQRKLHDRMLVAAAKAWKFRPALLNGHPVKYRVQIAIIIPPMPGVGRSRF